MCRNKQNILKTIEEIPEEQHWSTEVIKTLMEDCVFQFKGEDRILAKS